MAAFWLLVRVVLIVAVGVLAGSWLEGLARAGLDRTRTDPSVREMASRVVRPAVIALAVLIALAHLGLDLTGAIAVAAAVVLALGLAWRDTLANGAAGALILSWRPYRAGDRVWIADTAGVVSDVTLFATTLVTEQGVHVTVANARVLERAIENHTRNGSIRADLVLSVAYGADVAKLAAAVTDAIGADERFVKEPAPTLLAEGLNAESLVLRLTAWVKPNEVDAGRSALVLIARDALKKAKVDLAAAPR